MSELTKYDNPDFKAWEMELRLADELKKICNKRGKEINLKESAKIFHEIGLLYKAKTPHKISLIRSAALFNAALSRQFNAQYEDDLKELCFHILENAHAKQTDANLMQISCEVAEKLKEMRNETNTSLHQLTNITYNISQQDVSRLENKKVSDIQLLQDRITSQYTEVMRHIAKKCDEIIGTPPCEYAITGMGSLARREITPFSDFEHIILLEEGVQKRADYQQILEYFRWHSVIFQIIVINLQETIIPSMAIPCLNDSTKPNGDWFFDAFTTRGVSFDGLMPYACKCPLGRTQATKAKPWVTELIKPVSDMLMYLDSEVDLKNGYHLGDILTATCFVYGNEAVYSAFADQVKSILDAKNLYKHPALMRQLSVDLKTFDAFNTVDDLHNAGNCNIKRVVYRSTCLFISALGRLYSVDESSCFKIIEQLKKKSVIDDETAHHLSYAVAVACHVRLKVYMAKSSQNDYVGEDDLYDICDDSCATSKLVEIVGERSVVDYFVIAFSLQQAVRNKEALKNHLHLNVKSKSYTKFMMLYLLNMYDQVLIEWKKYSQATTISAEGKEEYWIRYGVARSYHIKNENNKALEMFEWLYEQDIRDLTLQGPVVINIGWCLYELRRYGEALQHTEEAKLKLTELNLTEAMNCELQSMLTRINGLCKYKLQRYHAALSAYEEELGYLENSDVKFKEIRQAGCIKNIGECFMQLDEMDQAIDKISQALAICKENNAPIGWACDCYLLLGRCCYALCQYQKAVLYFQAELDLRTKFSPLEKHESVEDIQVAKNNIQTCLLRLKT